MRTSANKLDRDLSLPIQSYGFKAMSKFSRSTQPSHKNWLDVRKQLNKHDKSQEQSNDFGSKPLDFWLFERQDSCWKMSRNALKVWACRGFCPVLRRQLVDWWQSTPHITTELNSFNSCLFRLAMLMAFIFTTFECIKFPYHPCMVCSPISFIFMVNV